VSIEPEFIKDRVRPTRGKKLHKTLRGGIIHSATRVPRCKVFLIELKIFALKDRRGGNPLEILIFSPGSLLIAVGAKFGDWHAHWDTGLTS
jgi:hypothetical protein